MLLREFPVSRAKSRTALQRAKALLGAGGDDPVVIEVREVVPYFRRDAGGRMHRVHADGSHVPEPACPTCVANPSAREDGGALTVGRLDAAGG